MLPYSGGTITIATGYLDKIFKLDDPANCGAATICSLKQATASCIGGGVYISSHISLKEGGSPWAIEANTGSITGWTTTFCYICNSPNQAVQ